MAKHARKVQAALKARQDNTPSGKQGEFHRPGSQNSHKTGYDPAPRG